MNILEIILIAVSLSTDAFSVALSKGLETKKLSFYHIIIVGLYFGIFQAIMPYIGYHITVIFGKYLIRFSHILAFIILTLLGINMLLEKSEDGDDDFSLKRMLGLSLGTSIDALAVGVTFTIVDVDLYLAITVIGIITFINSCMGVILGYKIKNSININPSKLGGIILILLAIKMLAEAIL